MKTFHSLANGNPGALHFLMQLGRTDVPVRTVEKIEKSGIIGTDLYVLYSDLCDRDMYKVVKLVDDCPLDILKDACSRQDYSGRELVSKYLND